MRRRVDSAVQRLFSTLARWVIGVFIILSVAAAIWGFALDGMRETAWTVVVSHFYWTAVFTVAVLLGYPCGAWATKDFY